MYFFLSTHPLIFSFYYFVNYYYYYYFKSYFYLLILFVIIIIIIFYFILFIILFYFFLSPLSSFFSSTYPHPLTSSFSSHTPHHRPLFNFSSNFFPSHSSISSPRLHLAGPPSHFSFSPHLPPPNSQDFSSHFSLLSLLSSLHSLTRPTPHP